ncbi:hypothetical protein KAX02_05400 [candidate division WOR-3 bacterium]|nr:hypothetical protein [candidate division WOR-3 bacterium]
MKWKKTIFILLLLSFVFTLATGQRGLTISQRWIGNWLKFQQKTTYIHQRYGNYIVGDTTNTTYGWGIDDNLDNAVKCRYLRNTSGGSVAIGDVVVWDQTVYVIVDTVARSGDPDTLTVALSGETEKNPLDVFSTSYSLANACSLLVTGINYAQTAVVETIIHTATGTVFSVTDWDTIAYVVLVGSDANDSVNVCAYQQSCFTTTTSDDDINHCGVVFSTSVADNKWGLIAYEGRMDSVECDASGEDAIVGRPVTTSNTAKHCEPRTSATAGDVLGRCLESDNTNGRIAIWLGGN